MTYHPTVTGTHTATLNLSVSVKGLDDPVTTQINLTGTGVPIPDVTPPAVVAAVPSVGTMGVPLNSPITITYNEPIVVANSGQINMNGDPVETNVSGNTLIIVPLYSLQPGTFYTVSVGAGAINDLSNNAAMDALSFSFTTTITPNFLSDPASLDFSTLVGSPLQHSFTLSGTGFSSLYPLVSASATITGTNSDQFEIDPVTLATILPVSLDGTAVLNVTYRPTTSGTHTAILNLSVGFEGVSDLFTFQVNLSGTATRNVDDPTGMENISKQVISEDIYTVSGTSGSRISISGFYVKRLHYEDGTTETVKVYHFVQ